MPLLSHQLAARLVYPFCGVINSCNMVQKKGRPSAALRPPPLFGGPPRLFADGIDELYFRSEILAKHI